MFTILFMLAFMFGRERFERRTQKPRTGCQCVVVNGRRVCEPCRPESNY